MFGKGDVTNLGSRFALIASGTLALHSLRSIRVGRHFSKSNTITLFRPFFSHDAGQ